MRDADREDAENARMRRVGEMMAAIGTEQATVGLEGGVVTDIRIRLPTEADPSVLLIVRASSGEDKHIAFVGAFSVPHAILAWRARCRTGGMKWREDVPFDQR